VRGCEVQQLKHKDMQLTLQKWGWVPQTVAGNTAPSLTLHKEASI